jgi:hypothetical protein
MHVQWYVGVFLGLDNCILALRTHAYGFKGRARIMIFSKATVF